MLAQAVHLDLNCGTPYPMALDLPLSFARGYFEHPVYTQHSKAAEAKQRLDVAVVERLNAVVKAIYGLGRALAGR